MEMSTGQNGNDVGSEVRENFVAHEISSGRSEGFFEESREIEGKVSMENAQELVEFYHNRSKEQILESQGEFISKDSYDRITNGVDSIEAVKYNENDSTIGSFKYHNGESYIRVSNIDQEQLERTTQHETNHFMSYNVEKQEYVDLISMDRKCSKYSGIHETNYIVDKSDRVKEFNDLNRGFNEGITQMYTNRQLAEIAEYKGELSARQNGYQHATELAEQLEDIVGKEAVANAYYGGDLQQLVEKVDKLGGTGSFERLSKDMDRVTYASDYFSRIEAMADAQELLAAMSEGGLK